MTYPTRVYGPHIGRRRIDGACPPDKATRYSARLAGTGGEPAVYPINGVDPMRITTTGNDRPYIVATGYQNTPRADGARFERPAGEPPIWAGVGVLVFVAIVAVFAAVAIGG